MNHHCFSSVFLKTHIDSILKFYEPCAYDKSGGFFHHFLDDGSIYDANTRHLVSSTRFVFNYAQAVRCLGHSHYLPWVEHGVRYIQYRHRLDAGYAWILDENGVQDDRNHCYGLAFVMVAGATALMAGVSSGRALIDDAWLLMSTHFWRESDGLYADDANGDFSEVSEYRGQNANMHACEALLWAYEATSDKRFLDRAERIAQAILALASRCDGLIFEHYDRQWQPLWNYNRDDPKHLFRPFGFQPGHQTEWAKLLLILNRHRPSQKWVYSAVELFDRTMDLAWDHEHGGIYYGFDRSGSITDDDKYFWVQAESFAAAALLKVATGDAGYSDWYKRIWDYSWAHMIDHQYGAWFRILTRDNQKQDNLKSPAGKTDYHTMGACYEVLRAGDFLH